jgi:hypothetical protein
MVRRRKRLRARAHIDRFNQFKGDKIAMLVVMAMATMLKMERGEMGKKKPKRKEPLCVCVMTALSDSLLLCSIFSCATNRSPVKKRTG